jgi:predicted PurR-regulated permease PerM
MLLPPPTPQQARIIWLAITGLAAAVLLGLGVGVIWGLSRVLQVLGPVLWPIAVGGVLAYILDPVVDFLQRKGVSRLRAIWCVFGLALALIVALAGSVVPPLIRQTGELLQRVPDIGARLEQRVCDWLQRPPLLLRRLLPGLAPAPQPPGPAQPSQPTSPPPSEPQPGQPQPVGLDKETLQTVTSWVATVLPTVGRWLFGQATRVAAWFGMVAGLALVPIYTFYFLLQKEGISAKWTDYLPVSDSRFKDELVFVLRAINNYLIVFFRGQVLVALSDGVLYAIGFSLVGVPYAVVLGAVAAVVTIIPFVGAIITCGAALLLSLVQHGDWQHPLMVLGVFTVVQALEGYVIQPKIIGDRVGLHPLTIIIALMVGATLLGGHFGWVTGHPAHRCLAGDHVPVCVEETRATAGLGTSFCAVHQRQRIGRVT